MQKRLKVPSWARAKAALCSTVRLGWMRTTHYREESLLEFLNLKLAKMRPDGNLHSGQNVPPLSRSIEGTKLPIRVVAVINEMAEWPIINRLWVNANHISGHRRIIVPPKSQGAFRRYQRVRSWISITQGVRTVFVYANEGRHR